MSKIYRRPMFRGGGTVSSYGNGITAPLVDGYQMGGQIGGGIIQGKPMNDGRYGFADPVFLPQKNMTFSQYQKFLNDQKTSEEDTSGSAISAKAMEKFNTQEYFDENIAVSDKVTDEKGETALNSPIFDYSSVGLTGDKSKYLDFGGDLGINQTKKLADLLKTQLISDLPSQEPVRGGGADQSLMDLTVSDQDDDGTKLNIDTKEPIVIDPKEAIAENQALFQELLGGKKARGQDISDMLLRFSGAKGDTVGEKFQNYTALEAAAGPGRGEKLNQTAAALAINDYVAGKRNKETGEIMKGKIDYQLSEQNKYKTPTLGQDSLQEALVKEAALDKNISANSVAALASVIKRTPAGAGKNVVASNSTIKKIDKLIKNPDPKKIKNAGLIVGYNIITEDGAKIIVAFDGTNLQKVNINDIWTTKK